MDKRVKSYDLIRTLAILLVFLDHIIHVQSTNGVLLLVSTSLSPGLTMSLLGFISASLISSREYDSGFLIKRFTRIYIPLIICLIVILCAHALIGKKIISQHTLLHFMGLSAFFDLFLVQNKATIGHGLWFITTITLMYLVLPALQTLFRHPHGLIHLLFYIALCTVLNFTMYGTASFWNVVISFAVGVYCGVNGHTKRLINTETSLVLPLLGCIGLLVVVALSTAHVLPYAMRGVLFALYPLTFVPFLFIVCQRLPTPIVAASSFFAGFSYEFYILHSYFINAGFDDFFPAFTPLYYQIVVAFIVTSVLAYVISKGASWSGNAANKYFLAK